MALVVAPDDKWVFPFHLERCLGKDELGDEVRLSYDRGGRPSTVSVREEGPVSVDVCTSVIIGASVLRTHTPVPAHSRTCSDAPSIPSLNYTFLLDSSKAFFHRKLSVNRSRGKRRRRSDRVCVYRCTAGVDHLSPRRPDDHPRPTGEEKNPHEPIEETDGYVGPSLDSQKPRLIGGLSKTYTRKTDRDGG